MARPTITELTNADPGFYPAIGPFLASHDVHIALGGVPGTSPPRPGSSCTTRPA